MKIMGEDTSKNVQTFKQTCAGSITWNHYRKEIILTVLML